MIDNSKAIEYWEEMAKSNPNEVTAKVNPQNDYTTLDAEFIMNYADSETEILDLASGTGMAISKYYERVGHIDAVEMFPEFSKFIPNSTKIEIFNESIVEFEPAKKYDLVLMFGVVQYFNDIEIRDLYTKYKKCLNSTGKLIIKNQFGVKEDVIVSGISEELQKNYHSQYRYIEKEIKLLNSVGFSAVKVFDIYPPEANRWENTHFYAIVASV